MGIGRVKGKRGITMSNVELVIKISESRYRLLQKQARTNLGREKLDEFAEVVLNGTPLPKGHGTISIDKIKEFKKEVESKYDDLANSWDEKAQGKNEMIEEVLEMIDELMESEDKE